MKYLSILFILGFTFNSALSQDNVNIKVDLIEVTFDPSLDFSELVKIKEKMANLGITLDYQILKFHENGLLRSISFKVDCNDGFKGSASAKLISKEKPIGFYRNYNALASSAFGTGNPSSK